MGVCCTKQDLTQIEENSKIVIKNQLKENNFNNEKTFYSEKSKKTEKVTICHFIRANLSCIILDGGIV